MFHLHCLQAQLEAALRGYLHEQLILHDTTSQQEDMLVSLSQLTKSPSFESHLHKVGVANKPSSVRPLLQIYAVVAYHTRSGLLEWCWPDYETSPAAPPTTSDTLATLTKSARSRPFRLVANRAPLMIANYGTLPASPAMRQRALMISIARMTRRSSAQKQANAHSASALGDEPLSAPDVQEESDYMVESQPEARPRRSPATSSQAAVPPALSASGGGAAAATAGAAAAAAGAAATPSMAGQPIANVGQKRTGQSLLHLHQDAAYLPPPVGTPASSVSSLHMSMRYAAPGSSPRQYYSTPPALQPHAMPAYSSMGSWSCPSELTQIPSPSHPLSAMLSSPSSGRLPPLSDVLPPRYLAMPGHMAPRAYAVPSSVPAAPSHYIPTAGGSEAEHQASIRPPLGSQFNKLQFPTHEKATGALHGLRSVLRMHGGQ